HRRAARILRRRRPRDPDRRARARAVRGAGLCAARDRPQPLRRRPAGQARRGVRGRARRGSRRPPGGVFGARRAQVGGRRRRVPRSEDICYATSNRQAAVKAIAPECDRVLVIGAPNSSNSLRLAEVAERMGAEARLIERAADIDWEWLGTPTTLGVTAGASAPETLVREVVDALRERFEVTEEEADHNPERMVFKL